MLRRLLQAVLVVIALACLVPHAQAAAQPRCRPVCNYLFGGYGPGPFGYGDFVYAGHPTYNYQAKTRVRCP